MVFDCVLVRYGEIGLKGGNRRIFEQRLAENIRWSLRREGVLFTDVCRVSGRFLVVTQDPRALDVLGKVFGLVSFSPALAIGSSLECVSEAAVKKASETKYSSFRVTVRRLDKTMDKTSQELNELIGAKVAVETGLRVDLKNPELNIGLDMTKDTTYIYTASFQGPGGLPVGSSARVVCLLSGGIDSPVAAWSMMKRGCPITLVHFMHEQSQSVPEKIKKITTILGSWGPGVRLIIVPSAELERELIMKTHSRNRILLLRRMFMKLAVRIMHDEKAHAIVAGDNLGQVASQTVENMQAIQSGIDALIIRPLACFDKQEIIGLANRIGTYETSIQAYNDCCSFLVSPHPQTKSGKNDLISMESELDAGILGKTLENKFNASL